MSTKLCSECNLEKPISEFDERSFCKLCKNKRDIARRKQKKQANKNELAGSESMKILLIKLQQMTNTIQLDILDTSNESGKIDHIIDSLQNTLDYVNSIKAERKDLFMSVKIPDEIQKYLELVYKDGGNVRDAKKYLMFDEYALGFEEHFEMNRLNLQKQYQSITDIECFLSFTRMVYQDMIDDYMMMQHSKFLQKLPPKIIMPSVDFDTQSNCIVIRDNPLKVNQEGFMKGVEIVSKKPNHYGFAGYRDHGYYDKFLAALC